MTKIPLARNFLLGKDSEITQYVPGGIEVQTDVYLKSRAEAQVAVILISEDPTGTLLIQESANREKGQPTRMSFPSSRSSFRTKEFCDVAADITQQAYKNVYPLVASIFRK